MMHANIPETDWNKVKSEIQKTWKSLSADDLEQTHGDVQAISGLVQKKYGLNRAETEKKLDECIDRCGTSAGAASVSPGRSFGVRGVDIDPSSESRSLNDSELETDSRSNTSISADSAYSANSNPSEQAWDDSDSSDAAFASNAESDSEAGSMELNSSEPEDYEESHLQAQNENSERNVTGENRNEFRKESESKGSASGETGNSRRSESVQRQAGNSQKSGNGEARARNSGQSSEASRGARDSGTSASPNARGSESSNRK